MDRESTDPQAVESVAPDERIEGLRPTGPAAAVLLAAGIGSLVLGLLTTLAELSEGLKDRLAFSDAVGSLSGKTIMAGGVFLVAWLILHLAWRSKEVRLSRAFLWTAILVAVGLVLTFPPVFEAFAPAG